LITIKSALATPVVFMALALLASGCNVDPPPRLSPRLNADVPERWTTTSNDASEPISQWWISFGNDHLAATVAEALESNHDLAAAAARIETAEAEARISGANLYPNASGSLAAARSRSNPGGSAVRSSNFGVSLDISWELDVWGRIRSGVRASVADLQAVQADYAGARLSLTAQTAKAWFAVVEARQQMELAEQTVANYRATAKQAGDRVQEGVGSPSDKHLSQSSLASAEALLAQRRQSLDQAKRQLEILLGRYPNGNIQTTGNLPPMPPPVPAGLPADIIRRRPDLVIAERRLAASSQRVDAAQAALYPRLSLTTSGGLASGEIGNLFTGDNIVWTIGGNLVQPIFEGGRLRATVVANEGRFKEAAELFAQRVLQAFSEVEITLAAEQFLAQRERALRVAADEALASIDVSQNRYVQGIESFIVVLESQRRALDAQSALYALQRQRLENRINLHLALGGGFDPWMPQVPDIQTQPESDNP
jgi:NodT family efflux transporter outer membrane factor (OMF) lipoprotein